MKIKGFHLELFTLENSMECTVIHSSVSILRLGCCLCPILWGWQHQQENGRNQAQGATALWAPSLWLAAVGHDVVRNGQICVYLWFLGIICRWTWMAASSCRCYTAPPTIAEAGLSQTGDRSETVQLSSLLSSISWYLRFIWCALQEFD